MDEIKVGDRVHHRLFADDVGTVTAVSSSGYVEVDLDRPGERMGAPAARWVKE